TIAASSTRSSGRLPSPISWRSFEADRSRRMQFHGRVTASGTRPIEREDVMKKRLVAPIAGASMLLFTAAGCGTLTGAAVGAGGGAAIGAGTGYGAGKGALIGTGVGAVAGAVYDIYKK